MRRRMMFNQGRLPAEYQEVEWVWLNNTYYIDTLYFPTKSTEIYIKVLEFPEVNKGLATGCRTGSSRFGFGWTISGIYIERGEGSTQANIIMPANEFEVLNSPNGYYLNNQLIEVSQTPNDPPSFSVYIGTWNRNNSPYDGRSVKIIRCTISDSNGNQRDYIPCYRKSDNMVGMYDAVNGVFYSSNTKNASYRGPDVN